MTKNKQEIKAFYELPIADYVEPLLHQIILEAGIPWRDYYQFKVKEVNNVILYRDPFFKWLSSQYEFKAGICRLPMYTCYDWHKDSDRDVSISMLLNKEEHHHSHCLFSLDRNLNERITNNFIELEYKPNRRYVFNNQVDHTVLNFDTGYRYQLTLEFKEKFTYNNFLIFLEKNKSEWIRKLENIEHVSL